MNNNKKCHVSMKEISRNERPYERFMQCGAKALSDEELLAVILRSGTKKLRVTEVAKQVLSKCEEYGGISHIADIPPDELLAIDGIGTVKAAMLGCVAELSRRMRIQGTGSQVRISSVQEAAHYMLDELSGLDKEEVWAVFLDGRNNIIKKYNISKGTANSSPISAREIFKPAIKWGACGVIIYHNHPSGDPEPSQEDISITKSIKLSARLMDIELVDHIIIGNMNYISLKNEGIL